MDSTKGIQTEGRHRHWCAQSQQFASGEVLLAYLRIGWTPDNLVNVETFYFGGHRHLDVYYFGLRLAGNYIVMPVPANPAVWNVIAIHQLTLQLREIGQAETQRVSVLDILAWRDRYFPLAGVSHFRHESFDELKSVG